MVEESSEEDRDAPVEVDSLENYQRLAGALLDADRRTSERLSINLLARCLLADGTEVSALMLDISGSGLALQCERRGAVGEPVIIYIEHLGRFEGTIVRLAPDGFAIELRLSQYRREKLRLMLDQLTEPQALEAARQLGWTKAPQSSGAPGRVLLVRKAGT